MLPTDSQTSRWFPRQSPVDQGRLQQINAALIARLPHHGSEPEADFAFSGRTELKRLSLHSHGRLVSDFQMVSEVSFEHNQQQSFVWVPGYGGRTTKQAM